MKTDARLMLRLLGRFGAETESLPSLAVRITSRKARGLIAYLAMHPEHRASREQLADLLWGDRFDTQARQSLRQGLVSLRRELETWAPHVLIAEGETVRLDPRFFGADATEFAALAESTDAADLERAADLYRGEFMAGLDLQVEAFDQWVRDERSRLAALAARVFASVAERADAAGDGQKAVAMAERLVEFDPLREDSQRLLLRLLTRHRSRDAALAHAKTVTALLRRELAVEPAPDTLALIDAIRRGGIAPAPLVSPIDISPDMAAPAAIASGPAGSPPVERWPWQRIDGTGKALPFVAIGLAGLIAVLAGWWLAFDPLSSMRRTGAPTAGGVASAADRSWRSPAIYPGATVDAQALGDQGLQAILVLPFSTEAGEGSPEQILADRITDDLTSDLSRFSTLRVIARQTARTYRGRTVDIAAIGAELGVRYAVEGSVRMQGSTVRINVALINAENRLQVWTDRFERNAAESLAVQDEIVRGIAWRLRLGVLAFDADRRGSAGAGISKIEELLAKGWASIFRAVRVGNARDAETNFEAVLRFDPDHVSALIGLAAFHIQRVTLLLVPEREPALGRADALLARAIRLNPNTGPAYYFRGVLQRVRGEYEPALASFAKMLDRNPSHAPSHAQVGHVMTNLGRPDEAIEHIRYAIRLSPSDPLLGIWLVFGGIAELDRGNDQVALDWLNRAVAMAPRSPGAHMGLAAIYALKGDAASASRHVTELRRLAPALTSDSLYRWFGTGGEAADGSRFRQGVRAALNPPS